MTLVLAIRAARTTDAIFAASLIHLSMHGLAGYLFERTADEIESLIVRLFERNAGRFGYDDAYIAEYQNEPVGLLIASRGRDLNRLNFRTILHLIAVIGFISTIGFVYRAVTLPGGKEAEDDEFFVNNLGVLPTMQGRSFGSQLLVYAEELARGHGLMKCSLIVGWQNTSARRLYKRIGYQIMETVQDKNETLGYYRMVKAL